MLSTVEKIKNWELFLANSVNLLCIRNSIILSQSVLSHLMGTC